MYDSQLQHVSFAFKFNGKERDAESGLDNFGARYLTSNLGRFMTPDWAARPTAVPYAVFGDPQSLNLYTFVRNDPVSGADADGHESGGGPTRGGPAGCTNGEKSPNPYCANYDDTKNSNENTAKAQNQIPLGGAPPAPSVPPQAFDDAHVNNMTVRQVGNVVANENRDVTPGTSSPQALQEAKTAQANAVMNADYQYGANRQAVVPTAPATDPNHLANTPQGQQALQAARTAFLQQNLGTDPTGNRVYYNNRFEHDNKTADRVINGHPQAVHQLFGPFSVGGGRVWTVIYDAFR